MTKLVVSIIVESLDQGLAAASIAAKKGADLVEYRIDLLAAQLDAVVELVERSPVPCIVTCRPTWEGGLFDGEEQQRLTVIEHSGLGKKKPAYIDIELATYQRSANIRQKIGLVVDHPGQVRATPTKLVLSTHDFQSQPVDLVQRVEAMAAASMCGVMKVAWRAESIRDNLVAFDLLGHRRKQTIALCMGEHGLPSRLLAKKFGAAMSFAALDAGNTTADGQPTIDQVMGQYRWSAIGAETRVYGVIGDPVGHSLSPAIHNAGFEAAGYDGVYLPLPVAGTYESFHSDIGAWLEAEDLDFTGASVTIPHKENLLRFVREKGGAIEPLADRIGAANTLCRRRDGSLYAANTDCMAAVQAVCVAMKIEPDELRGRRIAVIGAGGVARAVVAGFAGYGATVVIYNRTHEKAQRLADQLNSHAASDATTGCSNEQGQQGKIVPARLEKLCDSCCEVFINCTSVGMHPHVDVSPVPDTVAEKWGGDTVVFDTVYNPRDTKLLRQAASAGCAVVSGVDMFVRQAAIQFQLWTDLEAPIDLFRQVVDDRLQPST